MQHKWLRTFELRNINKFAGHIFKTKSCISNALQLPLKYYNR